MSNCAAISPTVIGPPARWLRIRRRGSDARALNALIANFLIRKIAMNAELCKLAAAIRGRPGHGIYEFLARGTAEPRRTEQLRVVRVSARSTRGCQGQALA